MNVNSRVSSTVSCLALLMGLSACNSPSAINSEILRSAGEGEEPELVSRICTLTAAGVPAGGGTNDFLVREEWTDAGTVRLTYLVPTSPHDVEDPLDEVEDADELEVAAVIEFSEDELESGEVFSAQFDSPLGVTFEVSHWGTPDCED